MKFEFFFAGNLLLTRGGVFVADVNRAGYKGFRFGMIFLVLKVFGCRKLFFGGVRLACGGVRLVISDVASFPRAR